MEIEKDANKLPWVDLDRFGTKIGKVKRVVKEIPGGYGGGSNAESWVVFEDVDGAESECMKVPW